MDNTLKPKFKLSRVKGAPVSDDELLDDLRLVAGNLGQSTVPLLTYRNFGKYDESTLIRRFGSWNAALIAAELSLSNEILISDERLFQNLLVLWLHLGRQPRHRELSNPPSTISQSPYLRRFGSWGNALQCFVTYVSSSEDEPEVVASLAATTSISKRTGRDISLRLRWKVMQRDRFTCCHCGASPAKTNGVELHIDHIVPWSKGGETTMENLQTLCSKCNLGKSDLDPL
ncbi:MAG: HNH endonuclease [bacterium]|nr:HNH endonuclease [bacterium]